MDLGLQGKVVLLTGAAGGIGRELAAGFASQGSKVVGVDLFLASQWSGAVTGQTIPVDRGLVKS